MDSERIKLPRWKIALGIGIIIIGGILFVLLKGEFYPICNEGIFC